jgi:hydroxyacylglutathione hydrolase
MNTPGHTTGSMSVIVDDEVALVGDTMFGVFKRSVFPPFADDVSEMIKSWGKLLNSNCKFFLPSHGREKSREQLMTVYNKKTIKAYEY